MFPESRCGDEPLNEDDTDVDGDILLRTSDIPDTGYPLRGFKRTARQTP